MTDHIEAVKKLVDQALADPGQHSPESTQYSDVAPTMTADGLCWRCTDNEVDEGSELCAGCRAFLLGDSEEDPAATRGVSSMAARVWRQTAELFPTFVERCAEALAEYADALTEAERNGDPPPLGPEWVPVPEEIQPDAPPDFFSFGEFTPSEWASGPFGGINLRFPFDNGWTASVVLNPLSRGGMEGLWELAVCDDLGLRYDSGLVGDELEPGPWGHLTPTAIEMLLRRVRRLPPVWPRGLRGAHPSQVIADEIMDWIEGRSEEQPG